MSSYPVWGMIETLFSVWGNSNKNEWLDGEAGKAHYHVWLREKRGSSQFCAWLLELVQHQKGDEKKPDHIDIIQPTVKSGLTWDYPHPFIIMRCYNVNIQYLPCNKSVSVYFPSTKREAGKQGTAARLEIWSPGPNTGLLRLARGQADVWYIWGAEDYGI